MKTVAQTAPRVHFTATADDNHESIPEKIALAAITWREGEHYYLSGDHIPSHHREQYDDDEPVIRHRRITVDIEAMDRDLVPAYAMVEVYPDVRVHVQLVSWPAGTFQATYQVDFE